MRSSPTDNAEAYDAYLHGLAAETRSFSSLEVAARFYAQATQLDPNFALAWARLSRVDARLVFAQWDTSAARRRASTQALDRAIALRPDATDTLLAQAYHRFYLQRDYAGAKLMFEQLRARLPGSSEVPIALSAIAGRQGLWNQSLIYADQAIALDPRDPSLLSGRAGLYSILRRNAEAIKTLDRRLEFVPGDPDTIAFQARIYEQQGQLDQARQLLGRLSPNQETIAVANARINLSLLDRDYPRLVELLTEAVAKAESPAVSYGAAQHFFLSFAQKQTGDAAAAEATNRRARRELEALRASQPDNVRYASQLGLIYAALGENALALEEGERAVALLPASRDAVQGPPCEEMLAAVEAQVGESSRAIDRLQHLLGINYSGRNGPITVALLRLDPIWDPLRGDPRFQKLIAEGEAPKPVATP